MPKSRIFFLPFQKHTPDSDIIRSVQPTDVFISTLSLLVNSAQNQSISIRKPWRNVSLKPSFFFVPVWKFYHPRGLLSSLRCAIFVTPPQVKPLVFETTDKTLASISEALECSTRPNQVTTGRLSSPFDTSSSSSSSSSSSLRDSNTWENANR